MSSFLQSFRLQITLHGEKLRYAVGDGGAGGEDDAFAAAQAQLDFYAADSKIVKMISNSKLHKIVMVFKGGDLVKLEEV